MSIHMHGGRTIHMHASTAGLIMRILENHLPEGVEFGPRLPGVPPVFAGTEDRGPYDIISDLLEQLGAPPNMPMGCPSPLPDGTCPGHVEGEG